MLNAKYTNENPECRIEIKGSKNRTNGSAHTSHESSSLCSGAKIVVESLIREGVDTVFGDPGACAIELYDAMYECGRIRHMLVGHEQGAVHAADGYSRSSAKVGTVIVTSGPGATNCVTGIATAYMDSSPLVVITAQVPSGVIGTDSFQESDIVGITMPIVKHSYLVGDASEIAETIASAYHIAKTGRPGPVVIDIPSDVLAQTTQYLVPEKLNMISYKPTYKGNSRQIKQAVSLILKSKRPVMYVGGGVVLSGASNQVKNLSDLMKIPVVYSLMGKSALPFDFPLNFGMMGMYGCEIANRITGDCDLVIAVGVRFSDRGCVAAQNIAESANIIHIDIDPAEISKIVHADVPIVGDCACVLEEISENLVQNQANSLTCEWLDQMEGWRSELSSGDKNLCCAKDLKIPEECAKYAIQLLTKSVDMNKCIVTTDVGLHQMWASKFVDVQRPKSFITSGGLGTMGFGLPAAIGCSVVCPDKDVYCISGDGSFLMNSQEMNTAIASKSVVKVILLNNESLGMVKKWQEDNYNSRFYQTSLDCQPDFIKLALAYDWEASSVSDISQLSSEMNKMIKSKTSYLLEVKL